MQMQKYEVGTRVLPPTMDDSVRFQVTDAGCTLLLMHYKPNAKWGESYTMLFEILYGEHETA